MITKIMDPAKLRGRIIEKCTKKVFFSFNSKGESVINFTCKEDKDNIAATFTRRNVEFYTYSDRKPKSFVIKGIDKDISPESVKLDLTEQGIAVMSVKDMFNIQKQKLNMKIDLCHQKQT